LSPPTIDPFPLDAFDQHPIAFDPDVLTKQKFGEDVEKWKAWWIGQDR
jgi:hypothetical protein